MSCKRIKWMDETWEVIQSLETCMEVDSCLHHLDETRRALEEKRVSIRDAAAEVDAKEETVEQFIDRIAKGKSEWVQDDFYECDCPLETQGNVVYRPKGASVSILRQLGSQMLCEACIGDEKQFTRVIKFIAYRLKKSIDEEQIERAKKREEWVIDPQRVQCRMSYKKDHHKRDTTMFTLRVSPALRPTHCSLCKECFASDAFDKYVNSSLLTNDIHYC